MAEQAKPALASSTIQGGLMAAVPIIVMVANIMGYGLSESMLEEVIVSILGVVGVFRVGTGRSKASAPIRWPWQSK